MSTQNTNPSSDNTVVVSVQETELKNALTIVELEERFEMTAVAAESSRCTYESAVA